MSGFGDLTDVSDEDEEVGKKIAEYCKNHQGTGKCEYLVRGATLICSNGSHKRKVNLPKCHGVYVGENPVLHELECVTEASMFMPGIEKQNVTFFGVCDPIDGEPPQTPVVQYIKLKQNSKDGQEGVVEGHRCRPEIIGHWRNTYEATRIVDNGDKVPSDRACINENDVSPVGQNTVTTDSFLVCKYGGLIEPIDSGQENVVSPLDFYDLSDYTKVTGYRTEERSTGEPVEKEGPTDFINAQSYFNND